MGPVRGNKKKRKMEKKAEENSLVSGSSEEGSTDWWDVLSKTITGSPSCSQLPDTFKSRFKVSRKTFDYICSLVKDHMTAKTHFSFTNGKPMSIHDHVALALTRLSSGNSLMTIGDSFGAHHSTVSQITWRFVEAIEQNALHHIQWPKTQNELSQIKCKFEAIRGLPNCCGAIDTCHITMQLTSSDPEAATWLDRRGNYSMTLQAIVDPDLRFRSIITGWPGKMDDNRVLRSSNFFKQCENGERLNRGEIPLPSESELTVREYVIGGSGFPLLPWLVTPYPGGDVSRSEAEFNERVVATHEVGRRALGRLRSVWKMIKGDMWRPDRHRLPRFILVCCILHNIVVDLEDKDEVWDDDDDDDDLEGYKQEQEACEWVDKAGEVLRDKLCRYFSGK